MGKLNIFAPAASVEEVKIQIAEGAKEIYIGLIEDKWINQFHNYDAIVISPNRRENAAYNFTSWQDVRQAVNLAHDNGCEVSFALNSHSYSADSIYYIDVVLNELHNVNMDYIILEDPYIVDYIHNKQKSDIKINLSGDAMVLSSAAAKWFQTLGVNRITFPQSITLQEIKEIASDNASLDFEVFMLNGKCIFNSGTCFCMHGFRYYDGTNLPPLCAHLSMSGINNREWYEARVKAITCGICALPFIKDIPNITSLKIVGRDISTSQKTSLTRFLVEALSADADDYQTFYSSCFNSKLCSHAQKRNCIYEVAHGIR